MQSSQRFDNRQFSNLSTSLETHMMQYGYRTVETPVIQAAELFLTRAGDQIIEQLFTFERRGKQYALRPEFTASAAALYAQQCDVGTVARWQFHGAVFEYHSSGNGGSYQHYASGAELLGLAGPLAEAEILAMAAHGLTKHGIEDWRLVIGNVQLVRHLLSSFQLDSRAQRFLLGHLLTLKDPDQGKPYVLELLDKLVMGGLRNYEGDGGAEELNTQQLLDVLLDATQRGGTMGGRTRHDIVRRLLQKRQRAAERDQFVNALDFLEAWCQIDAEPAEAFEKIKAWIAKDDLEAQRICDDWQQLLTLLEAFGISSDRIRVQPALARNWDYYTGIVFELTTADNGRLGGGGRYDELARLLGAEYDVPAVGFTYYADQLLDRIPQARGKEPELITIFAPSEAETAGVRWSHALRKQGYQVELTSAGTSKTIEQNGSSADASYPAPAPVTTPEMTSESIALHVQRDGAVEWHGNLYTLAEVGNLIAFLENR